MLPFGIGSKLDFGVLGDGILTERNAKATTASATNDRVAGSGTNVA
jgi:hypothetical protein